MAEQTALQEPRAPTFELKHRLALALEDAALKPEDMAGYLGRSITTIRNYLGGRTTPSRGVLVAWALRTEVPLDWLEQGVSATGWLHRSVVAA